ncbi:MAG: GNAT family N-acetyltransferase [Hyphomicrobium sp.]|nr:GNAT family N-acetyltransferase [Hyphomicrobium sp.]
MSSASPRLLPVQLEVGSSNDLDGVMAVMTTAFDPDFGEGWSRSQCAGILPLSGVTLTIALDDLGQARGFALQRTAADESELLLIAVNHASQRCGIGGRLLDHFVDTSRTAGATRLHLEVRDGNPAVAMYEAVGFAAEGRRFNYYRGSDGRLFDAVTMVLDLNRT